MADEPGMQRLMARAAARDQHDLARFRMPPPHEAMIGIERQYVGMSRRQPLEAFREHGLDAVDQLLHGPLLLEHAPKWDPLGCIAPPPLMPGLDPGKLTPIRP
jgi:hypothetical protein